MEMIKVKISEEDLKKVFKRIPELKVIGCRLMFTELKEDDKNGGKS